ncbi:hypothetical protein FI667_g9572, partial [Globisporangium splendens]
MDDGGGETVAMQQEQPCVDDMYVVLLLSDDDASKLQVLQCVLDSPDSLHAAIESDVAIPTLCDLVAAENQSNEIQRVALDVLSACIAQDETIIMMYDVVRLVVMAMERNAGDTLYLMQFLRQLKENKPHIALYPLCTDVARVPLRQLLQSGTSRLTMRILMELLELLVHEGDGCKNAINETLLGMIGAATTRASWSYSLQRWRRITIWKLGPHLPDVADILREGDCVEQFILLKCLSGNNYSVLENFVLFHQGGPVLANLSQQEEHLDVKQLALDLEREVVSHNPEYRSRFVKVVVVEGTGQQKPDSYSYFGDPDDAVEKLQHGTVYEKYRVLDRFMKRPFDVVYACAEHDLFAVLSSLLENKKTSGDLKLCIWTLLLTFVKDLHAHEISTVPGIRTLIAIVLRAFEGTRRPFQKEAMEMLRSDFFFHSATNRDLLVDSGILGTLVYLLVREENATRAEALVTYLCGLTAVGYRQELDLNVKMLLENASLRGSSIQYEVMYFQNLVPLYCEVSGLQLGKLEGIDKLICERLLLDVLRDENEVAQLAAILFIYDAMELSDRCQFEDQRSDATAIAGILFDYIDDLVAVSANGPEEGRELVLQILLALDLSLAGDRPNAAARADDGMQLDACYNSDDDEDDIEQSEEARGCSDVSDDDNAEECMELMSGENVTVAPSKWLDEAVEQLERGTEGSIIVALNSLNADILYAYNEHDVLAILSKLLERPSTSESIKLRIWTMLLTFVDDLRPLNITTVPKIRTLIKIVLRTLTDDPSFRELVMEMLRSHVLYESVANRDLLVDRGILSTLVNLLVREENAARADAILTYLRDFTEPEYKYDRELGACVETLLENASAPGSPFQYDAIYFQNLVPLYCDDSGLQLGKLESLDKAICVRLTFDILRYGSYLAQLAAALFLHDSMEISARYQFGVQRSDKTAIIRIVSDRIDDLVTVSTSGPEIVRELVRQILSALDVSLVSDRLHAVLLDDGEDKPADEDTQAEEASVYYYSDDDGDDSEQNEEAHSDDGEEDGVAESKPGSAAGNGSKDIADQDRRLTVATEAEEMVEAPESISGDVSSDDGDWELV